MMAIFIENVLLIVAALGYLMRHVWYDYACLPWQRYVLITGREVVNEKRCLLPLKSSEGRSIRLG